MMGTETTALEARLDAILPTLATKADLKALEGRFDAFAARFETILPTLATKADLLATKADLLALQISLENQIHRGHVMLCRWMVATMVGMFIGFGGMFFAASNFLRLSVQATAAPYTAPAPLSPNRPSTYP